MSDKDNVKKTDWGYELIWANSDTYSGKILVFEGLHSRTNMFFHRKRKKTLFINSGKFKIRWVDTKDGNIFETELDEGATHTVEPLVPIQICSLNYQGSITEVGDNESPDDNFVILKSNSIA